MMKKVQTLCAITLCTLIALPAFAMSLTDGKTRGLVGERLDGYIGSVHSAPPADVQQLVAEVNRARKAEYQKIANGNGQPVSVVETLAAKKLIERASMGEYYMDASGAWKQK